MMPGNKNSGRKKKIVPDDPVPNTSTTHHSTVSKPTNRGRPRKSNENRSLPYRPDDVSTNQVPRPRSTPVQKHVSTLQRRSSEMSKFYDAHLGPALEKFNPSKLPMKRTILQRYRDLRAKQPTVSQHIIVGTISSEIYSLWERSAIPCKSLKHCKRAVSSLLSKWTNGRNEEKVSTSFQENLDVLFDVRRSDCMDLDGLKSQLKATGNVDWLRDYDFFLGQLVYPQTSTMSHSKDMVLDKKVRKREARASKTLLYASQNHGDFSSTVVVSAPSTKSVPHQISPETIILDSKRTAHESAKSSIADHISLHENNEQRTHDDDPDWELPYRERRRLSAKPEQITLTFPTRSIPTMMAATSVVTKTSTRHELKFTTTFFKAGGGNINDVNLSQSTIYRQRKKEVSSKAESIRENIRRFGKEGAEKSFLVFHWDGKIVKLMTGDKEEHLAIAVSSPNQIPGQYLASPVVPDGTGATMAQAVREIASEYGLLNNIEALVFDTTASNTGLWRGSVTLFEKILGRPVLWLACRHHVPELHIKHANEVLRGPSKGPEDPLFQRFKTLFPSLHLENRSVWKWPSDSNDWRYKRAIDVLEWADHHMQVATWCREDYRELLELVVIYFGGVVKRVRNKSVQIVTDVIRKPGALHRARFMASCLYILKLFIFHDQLRATDITPEESQDIEILAEYIALLHAQYFLQSPLASAAPRLDRNFWISLNEYQQCFSVNEVAYDVIEGVKKSVLLHLWYLTEQLVVLGLFDDDLPDDERKAVATKLMSTSRPSHFNVGKPAFPTDRMSGHPSLDVFIGKNSWLLFHNLNATGKWLERDVDKWKDDVEYIEIKKLLRDMKVVNDLAERCVKDTEDYADAAKDPIHRDNILLVVSDHRRIFSDLRKCVLSK